MQGEVGGLILGAVTVNCQGGLVWQQGVRNSEDLDPVDRTGHVGVHDGLWIICRCLNHVLDRMDWVMSSDNRISRINHIEL